MTGISFRRCGSCGKRWNVSRFYPADRVYKRSTESLERRRTHDPASPNGRQHHALVVFGLK